MAQEMTDLVAQHITVPRTARYYTIGTPSALVRDLWITCHGYGQLAADFAGPFRGLERPDRLIVVPEALSRFYWQVEPPHTPDSKVGALWMTREDREMEIEDIVSYLDLLAEHVFDVLAGHGALKEQVRLHALGFSQGAPVISRWATRGKTGVGHLVLWGSGLPNDVNSRSIAERGPVRVDLVYGRSDRFVSPEAVAAQEAILAGGGVPHRVLTFDGGHTLNRELLRRLFDEG